MYNESVSNTLTLEWFWENRPIQYNKKSKFSVSLITSLPNSRNDFTYVDFKYYIYKKLKTVLYKNFIEIIRFIPIAGWDIKIGSIERILTLD